MRVIAGSMGGRRLQAPRGARTRPTAERVREALFAMLGSVADAEVLDLFAGCGALGIEALSRGARAVAFVERDADASRALAANLASLRSARGREETYDLVFIDPPYRHAHEWGPRLSAMLPPLLRPGARVVVESDRRAPLELALPVERRRRYGDTSITIHRHQ